MDAQETRHSGEWRVTAGGVSSDDLNNIPDNAYQLRVFGHQIEFLLRAMTLDSYDIALLAAIQKDATTPQHALGAQVNLSSAAVNRRLKKLSDEGVTRKTVSLIDAAQVGYPLTIITEVEVENERLDLLDAMRRSFLACPQVQQCYYVAGECDFVVIMVVQNMAQYTELTRALFFESNNVKRFKTLVSMSNVKVGLEVPMDGVPG